MTSKFATAERQLTPILQEQNLLVERLPYIANILNALPELSVIINYERQIIFANQLFIQTLGIESIHEILGARPGEAFSCVHAFKSDGGCGTTDACKYCGAIAAVLHSQASNKNVSKEVMLSTNIGDKSF